ncbi:LysM domain protein [Pelotomaculum sp. FP]|uniref:CIS tube protein n=1 Tax=Pelotomaculum sp. FP TaxID=261474 RepID=UPI001066FABE|nr:LysM peptidoglycan-binding domain-containing protein [Pelotomaculum sp. FP]TEB15321.1 LysM domain protein [Pelotomaculum sp. FP]
MLVKASLTRKDKSSQIVPFLFNPSEFAVEKSNQFTEVSIPGLPSSLFQFVKGGARTLTMDLFFDTYESGQDVRLYTDWVTGWDAGAMYSKLTAGRAGLMDLDADLHAPPVCLFIWGSYIFQCIIERVSKRFTMFLPDGLPVRATLNVSLKEYRDFESQVKEISLQSADITKRWIVKQGESLWLIAAKVYGDPALWRHIAAANGIVNPRLLAAGSELVVPPLG